MFLPRLQLQLRDPAPHRIQRGVAVDVQVAVTTFRENDEAIGLVGQARELASHGHRHHAVTLAVQDEQRHFTLAMYLDVS